MPDNVTRHWIVGTELEGGFPERFDTLDAAIADARTRAANTSGTIYVVYQAMKYAIVDETPVTVRTVAVGN